MRKRKA